MIKYIRKISIILSAFVFFLILFNGISFEDPFDTVFLFPALIKALLGGVIFWIVGFIISDIIIKGVIEDIPNESLDLLEGGIIQRLKQHDEKKQFDKTTKVMDLIKEKKETLNDKNK